MSEKKRNFSIEFPADDKTHHAKKEQHYDIHEYSSDEVAKMRQQAESIINLTKAMGVDTDSSHGNSDAAAETKQTPSEAQSAPKTREDYRASLGSASHPRN